MLLNVMRNIAANFFLELKPMSDTTFDVTASRTTKKTCVGVSLDSLKVGNDAYQFGMAIQENGEEKVVRATADYYVSQGMGISAAHTKAGTVVGHYIETMENGGLFKTVRANLKNAETLKA